MSNRTNQRILEALYEDYQTLGGSNHFLRFFVDRPICEKIEMLKELNEMLETENSISIKYSKEVTEYPPEYEADMEELELRKMLETIEEIKKKTLKKLKNKK